MELKKSILCALALVSAGVVNAGAWKGLDDASYYSGPKITEADLAGKVVLVDCWGVNCGPCKALLPKMEKIWESFRSKPFMLVGAHWQGRQPDKVKALVDANKLSYPIYDRAGLATEPHFDGLPFFYVVNHRGKIIFQGDGVKGTEQEAIEAIVNALTDLNAPPTLAPGIVFGKKSPYKALEKNLMLGKPAAPIVKQLTADVKKADSKAATPVIKAKAEEAKAILEAIETAKSDFKTDIAQAKVGNPVEALKLVQLYMKSFPAEGAEYKEELPELQAKAKEAAAEAKIKAAEEKKAAAAKKGIKK